MITGKRISLTAIAALLLTSSAAAGRDTLAEAMNALESGRNVRALELSTIRQPNPWLDVYRMLVRAEAFLAAGDSASASAAALSGSKTVAFGEAGGHPAGARLIDIAILAGGPGIASALISDDLLESLSPLSLVLAGRHYAGAGDSAAAVRCLASAQGSDLGEVELEILDGMVSDGKLSALELPVEIHAGLASAAISSGEYGVARRLVGLVASEGRCSWLAEILEADMLAESGRKSKALTRYTSIHESAQTPLEGRKRSLQRIAALQYGMRRFRGSSSSYSAYGAMYPDDPMAEMSLDRAARIEVAAGRWESAVSNWMRIADRGPKTLTGREAMLGMAAALEKMGRKGEACSVLRENLRYAGGRLREAYLYWIARTCSDALTRSDYSGMLSDEFGHSFYSVVLEEGTGSLTVAGAMDHLPRASLLGSVTRKEPFPRPGRAEDHHALGAFRYLVGAGLKAVACDCARSYLASVGGQGIESAIGTVYSEAREAGMESLCLELAVDNPEMFAGREDYIEFLYPVAFGAEIDEGCFRSTLPPGMVLAVIREESRFDEDILSPAGARGLMQIMPATGEWIGGKIGRRDVDASDLRDPGFNIEAGCWYLRFLLERGDDSIVAALASYNAGHGRMRSWKKKFRPQDDPLAALELIGPSETRRYVRRVLDTMAAYGRLKARCTE